ncbi:hypothetical protein SPI_01798 [Niveomyces insectorum RCEF 264]|uniref:Uncharacterized protein n=1 Tax=Niveomyces insectorum RCEF 264 TaxID=1081102 RepID=A0A162JD69_9HYPO|nr:hypothetical protein SPI_01798 [Niveomyces insectorum RCEF 264]
MTLELTALSSSLTIIITSLCRFRKPIDVPLLPLRTVVLLGISVSFMTAWNFTFPTYAERVLWRACSLCHCVLSIYDGLYCIYGVILAHRTRGRGEAEYEREEVKEEEEEEEEDGREETLPAEAVTAMAVDR